MKLKHLVLLVLLAVIFGGWAYWASQKKFPSMPSAVGAKVLPSFPINDVRKIQIMSSGTNITVAKTGGGWTVVDRFNYPAKFDKIVESLQELSELKVGQVVTVAEPQLGQFTLLSPATAITPELSGKTGTLLQLFNDKNQVLASLLIGKHFMHQPPRQGMDSRMAFGGYPDGQYVRTAEGKVFLVSKTLDRLTESAKTWLDDEFINVPAQDIMEMTVTGPDRSPITLRRAKEGDPLTLDGVRENEGTIDTAKVSQMAGSLNYLGFDDVAAPTLTAKETGLDRPIVVNARTRQGQRYTLNIGNTLTNDTFDRYVQVAVAYEPPPQEKGGTAEKSMEAKTEKEDQPKKKDNEQKALAETTKALNTKLSPWIYVVKSYRAESLLQKREEMIKKPEPAKKAEPAAGTNALPAKKSQALSSSATNAVSAMTATPTTNLSDKSKP